MLVVSILGTVAVYSSAAEHLEVLSVRQAVPAGQQIEAADLATVAISTEGELAAVPAAEVDDVIGQVAAVGLVPGSLLSSAQLSDGPRVPVGMVVAGAMLQPGQYPNGLRPGDRVLVVESPPSSATGEVEPIERGEATVLDVADLDDVTSALTVSLVIPAADASTIAAAGSAGRLSLVITGIGR